MAFSVPALTLTHDRVHHRKSLHRIGILTLHCFLTGISLPLFAQSTFQLKVGRVGYEEYLGGAVEYPPNHCYYCCGYSFRAGLPRLGRGMIIRFNPQGDTIQKLITVEDTIPFLQKLFSDENNNQMVILGNYYSKATAGDQFLLMGIDTLCNILWTKSIAFRDSMIPRSNYAYLLKKEGGFYAAGSFLKSDGNFKGIYIFDFNADYDTIRARYHFYSPYYPTPCSMTYNADSSRLWIFGHEFLQNNSFSQRVELDTNLAILRTQPHLPLCEHYQYTRWVSDSTLFTAANHVELEPPHEEDISLSLSDTALNIKQRIFVGTPDTVNYMAISQGLDFITPDSLFILADNHIISFWPAEYTHLLLYLYSNTMHPYYTRYIGGDAYYRPSIILATSDGGCLITSQRYDYQVNQYEDDVTVLKLGRDGLLTGLDGQGRQVLFKSVLYPNPVRDRLTIETLDPGGEISIFTTGGQLVAKQSLQGRHTSLNVSKLPSGSYPYTLNYKTGKPESGTLIKL